MSTCPRAKTFSVTGNVVGRPRRSGGQQHISFLLSCCPKYSKPRSKTQNLSLQKGSPLPPLPTPVCLTPAPFLSWDPPGQRSTGPQRLQVTSGLGPLSPVPGGAEDQRAGPSEGAGRSAPLIRLAARRSPLPLPPAGMHVGTYIHPASLPPTRALPWATGFQAKESFCPPWPLASFS